MKSKLGALAVLVALSSVVMMLGFQKYSPKLVANEANVAFPENKAEPREPVVPKPHRSRPDVTPPAVRPEVPGK